MISLFYSIVLVCDVLVVLLLLLLWCLFLLFCSVVLAIVFTLLFSCCCYRLGCYHSVWSCCVLFEDEELMFSTIFESRSCVYNWAMAGFIFLKTRSCCKLSF